MEENVRKKLDTKIITPVLVPLEEQGLMLDKLESS